LGATRDSDRVLGGKLRGTWPFRIEKYWCNDASSGYGYVEPSVVGTVDDEMERVCNETAC